jgi:hypothetical protein
MLNHTLSAERENSSRSLPLLVAGLTLLIHAGVNALGGYGYFRDELYYLACARHLDFGYVDHPPLSIWVLAVWTMFGDSLFALRFPPAVLGACTVYLAGAIARDLGGGRHAQLLSSVAVGLAPIVLGFSGLYTMNAFDLLFWALTFSVLVRLLRSSEPRSWYLLGVLLGTGAMNKLSMLWLACGLALGFLLTEQRRQLRSTAPWIAVGLAIVLFSPYVIWNLTHDGAHLEFIRRAAGLKYSSQNPLTFFSGLVLIMNPMAVPLWIAGFWFLLRNGQYRVAGLAVTVVLLILLANVHSKAEYFAGAMMILIPAGAVQWERLLSAAWIRWTKVVYPALLVAVGLLLFPYTMDILPVTTFLRYQEIVGIKPPNTEGHRLTALPQHYADRFGWEHMAEVVAGVYAELPDSLKRNCLVYGRNYGEAAAVDFFGRKYGLPPAISQHNSYWYWGMRHLRPDVTLVVIGRGRGDLLEDFEVADEVARIRSDYVMPYENDLPVTVCRKPRRDMLTMWAEGKTFI